MGANETAMASTINELFTISFSDDTLGDEGFRCIYAVLDIDFSALSDQSLHIFHTVAKRTGIIREIERIFDK